MTMTTELTRVLPMTFEDAERQVTDVLKTESFGVLTRIDVQATLREKIGAALEPYVILGACNPRFAHRALSASLAAGLMLPCNVVLHREADGVRVRAVDPVQQVKPFDDPALVTLAEEVRASLERALAKL